MIAGVTIPASIPRRLSTSFDVSNVPRQASLEGFEISCSASRENLENTEYYNLNLSSFLSSTVQPSWFLLCCVLLCSSSSRSISSSFCSCCCFPIIMRSTDRRKCHGHDIEKVTEPKPQRNSISNTNTFFQFCSRSSHSLFSYCGKAYAYYYFCLSTTTFVLPDGNN